MLKKHLLAQYEVFPGDVFVVESFAFLFIDDGICVRFVSELLNLLEL